MWRRYVCIFVYSSKCEKIVSLGKFPFDMRHHYYLLTIWCVEIRNKEPPIKHKYFMLRIKVSNG